MTEYTNILNIINRIVEDKGYSIHNSYDDKETAFMFEIKHGEIEVSYAQMYNNADGNIRIRQEEIDMSHLISISSVSTNENYRGQGLALLVLIYGICYLKNQSPDINYAILDDDSDNSTMIKGNIYNSIGFEFVAQPELDPINSNKLVPLGPEKQLMIDGTFITNVTKLLNEKFTSVVGPVGKVRTTKKSVSLRSSPYNLRDRKPLRSSPYNLRDRKPKGGKKSNRKTKKYKRKTKRRRY